MINPKNLYRYQDWKMLFVKGDKVHKEMYLWQRVEKVWWVFYRKVNEPFWLDDDGFEKI